MHILLTITETTQTLQETTTKVANEMTTQLSNETVNQIYDTAQIVSITKDVFWIIFTLIATVIAVLTFLNAKKSLFHPLHSEVIKRQTDRFVEVYDLISGNVFEKIDYSTIYNICYYCGLQELGYDIEIPDDVAAEYNIDEEELNLVFGVPVTELTEEEIDNFDEETKQRIMDSMEKEDSSTSNVDEIEEVIEEYEFENRHVETIPNQIRYTISTVFIKGRPVHLGTIPQTKKSIEFFNKLGLLRNDPLLPSEFRGLLDELNEQALNNMLEKLSKSANFAICEVWDRDEIDMDEVESIAVNHYNEMIERFIKHEEIIAKITQMINSYLKIDNLFK